MIYLDREKRMPLYEQIYESIRRDILEGRLAGGERLPATRRLASDLVVGRNTVENAYQQLLVEGYVSSKVGSGYVVNHLSLPHTAPGPADTADAIYLAPEHVRSYRYDFRISRLDQSAFPVADFKRHLGESLKRMGQATTFDYPPRAGSDALREAIARHLYASRGISTRPENIVVTCGHQFSLDVICTLLRQRRLRVAMEDPGYPGAHSLFALHGAKMIPIPVEKDGIDIDAVRRSDANLLYITPSHQYPTGAVLPIQKRLEAVEWATSTGGYIIENDYDSELRYTTRPIPPLFSMDQSDCVIYIGTLSRPISLELGLGYLILPTSLLEDYRALYTGLHYNSVPPLVQDAVTAYINSGDCARHLDRFRASCRKKHDRMIAETARIFAHRVHPSAAGAGLHLLYTVPGERGTDELIGLARRNGVKLYSIHSSWLRPQAEMKNLVILGYGGIALEEITPALELLYQAWFT